MAVDTFKLESGRQFTLLPVDATRGFPQSFPMMFDGRTYFFRLYIDVAASVLTGRTRLLSGIDSRATRMTVESTFGFPSSAPFNIRVDEEIMLVGAIDASEWRVTRGAEATTPTLHRTGSAVTRTEFVDMPSGESFLVVQVEREVAAAARETIFLRKVVPELEYECEKIALAFPRQRVARNNLNGKGDYGSIVVGGIAQRWA